MERSAAIPYVSFGLDDALSERPDILTDLPESATLVGWQCGFEPLFVAVISYLGGVVDGEEAEEIATDYLQERGWFSDNENPPVADYVIDSRRG